jgi:hypothetical protein
MATKKVYDLAVKVGEYTDREGKVKGKYQTVGCVLEKDDGGKFLMLEKWFNPAGVADFSANGAGKTSVLVSMFPPKERDGEGGGGDAPRQQRASTPGAKKAQEMLGKQQDYGDIPF